jgi:hypothetical protein
MKKNKSCQTHHALEIAEPVLIGSSYEYCKILVARYWMLDTPARHIRNPASGIQYPASALVEKARIPAYSSLFPDKLKMLCLTPATPSHRFPRSTITLNAAGALLEPNPKSLAGDRRAG